MPITKFQDAGQLSVGAVVLDKVVEVNWEIGGEPTYTDYTRSGDTQVVEEQGLEPSNRATLTVRLYSETGLSDKVKTLRKGTAGTKNVAITLQPEGDTVGLPEQVWPGMTMTNKKVDAPTGAGRPPMAATLTFKGVVEEEPEWEAIS